MQVLLWFWTGWMRLWYWYLAIPSIEALYILILESAALGVGVCIIAPMSVLD
jgi:hypothetical protein